MDASLPAALLLSVSGLGCLYLLVASVLVLWRRAAAPAVAAHPSVTIMRPLHGAEPNLIENLASVCEQDYDGPVTLVCGVQSATDPAIGVVDALRARFPTHDIRLVVDATLHGTNRKVSNLVNMEREVAGEVVVLADSDIVVPRDYLSRLVAELARPGVGAVTCLYHGVPLTGRFADLATLAIDTHFLPGVVVGSRLGLAEPCLGSTIALRRETLARIGGFRSVKDDLADDYLVGAKVRALGLRVAIPSFSVGHVFAERSLAELARQELRWARTIRQVDPAGHAGSAIAHPLAFALLALLIDPGVAALLFAALAVACRTALCLAVERAFGLKPHRYRLVPLRDALSFAIFVASFTGRRVSWRGQRYDVAPTGVLVQNPES